MTEREKLDVSDSLTELNLPVRLPAFIEIVRARLPGMVAPADFDGARRSAAAALLAKAVDLLEMHCAA